MATRLLNLYCSRCDAWIVRYRKQGTGNLVRLYLDRVIAPRTLADLKQVVKKSDLPSLTCAICKSTIGIPSLHEGKRPVYRLIKGSFRRKESG